LSGPGQNTFDSTTDLQLRIGKSKTVFTASSKSRQRCHILFMPRSIRDEDNPNFVDDGEAFVS
jgi:hypothetical protein